MSKNEWKALYDDPALFSAYERMRAQDGRLNDLLEAPALRSLLPSLEGLRVVDLGCGTGEMCRWLRSQGASTVMGYDVSTRMLGAAREASLDDPQISFHCTSIEELRLAPESFDLVVSSLALHYVADFAAVASEISRALAPSGVFVFSVEHPIVTCSDRQWHLRPDGERLHWPVDRYAEEGPRRISWLGLTDVPRHHRTVESYVSAMLDAGLVIRRLLEPVPTTHDVEEWPRLAHQRRRPPLLLLRADKPNLVVGP